MTEPDLLLHLNTTQNKKLLDWIDISKLHFDALTINENAVHLLEQNQDKINWKYLSLNENAVHLLEKNPDKINWDYLSGNKNAIHLLEKKIIENIAENKFVEYMKIYACNNIVKDSIFFDGYFWNKTNINWRILSRNENAVSLLERYPDKIVWPQLSSNPNAIPLLEKYPHKIYWPTLSENPNAMHLLRENPFQMKWNKINWKYFARNTSAIDILEIYMDEKRYPDYEHCFRELVWNKNAMHILEKYLDKLDNLDWKFLSRQPYAISILEKNLNKVDWRQLSNNPAALHILEQNKDKINWYILGMNPGIFV